MPGPEAAAAAGDGAAQCLPEQDQDADRGAARSRAAEAGAEGVTAPGSPGTKGVVNETLICTSHFTGAIHLICLTALKDVLYVFLNCLINAMHSPSKAQRKPTWMLNYKNKIWQRIDFLSGIKTASLQNQPPV